MRGYSPIAIGLLSCTDILETSDVGLEATGHTFRAGSLLRRAEFTPLPARPSPYVSVNHEHLGACWGP